VKPGSITAIVQLFAALNIAGCIVTIDAMGCQKEIAQDIVEKEGSMYCPSRNPPGNSL
jgi:predicted transposase YbfD/YdcC